MADIQDYKNIDLEISTEGDGYSIKVRSHQGADNAPFPSPLEDDEIKEFLSKVRKARLRAREINIPNGQEELEEKDFKEFGQSLFDKVFTGKARDLLMGSLPRARNENVRLKLTFQDKASKLATLPWEYLWNPITDNFFCINRSTSLVRYLGIPRPLDPLEVEEQVKILIVTANPRGDLDVDSEIDSIKKALKPLEKQGRILCEILKEVNWQNFRRELVKGYHIFHFIGHGNLDSETEEGALWLKDGPANQRDLGNLLSNAPNSRLVILNNCNDALGSESDVFSGVAQQIIKANVPAVVAMQFAITDNAAIKFADEFYYTLADSGNVENALVMARVTLAETRSIDEGIGIAEWGTPVLFLRSNNTTIFTVPEPLPPESNGDENTLKFANRTNEIKKLTNTFKFAEHTNEQVTFIDSNSNEQKIPIKDNSDAVANYLLFVSGPPHIGKSFLIEKLLTELKNDNAQPKMEIKKEQATENDARAVWYGFFPNSIKHLGLANKNAWKNVSNVISNKPTLCILDNAELLDEEEVLKLRQFLDKVIFQGKNSKPNLGFLVVSRHAKQQDSWKSQPEQGKKGKKDKIALTPFKTMELTPFEKIDDVEDMLKKNELDDKLENGLLLSKYLYSISEGLPALLKCCIDWYKNENNQPWQIAGLEESNVFGDYVEQHILSNKNLYPKPEFDDPVKNTHATQLIKDILLELIPFRLLHRAWFDEALRQVEHKYSYYKDRLNKLSWNENQLFEAIKNSYLIKQTDNEESFTIHKPIRRILFRYHFTQEEQLEAHTKAANCYEKVFPQLQNRLGIGFVIEIESFWHNIERFRLSQENPTWDGILDEKSLFEFLGEWKEKIIEKYKASYEAEGKNENNITSSLRANIENKNDSEIMQSLNALSNSLGSKIISEIHSS